MSTGPIGYLIHWSSGKFVHPRGGSPWPDNGTKLAMTDDKNNHQRLQFRFQAVDGAGHYGYIVHVSTGRIIHPEDGHLHPRDNDDMILHSDRHASGLFGFDEENKAIFHKSGKFWHSEDGSPKPRNDKKVVLYTGVHDAARFYFGDINGKPMSPYPKSNLSGDWKLLKAFITPLADHKYTETYKVGKSKEESKTENHAWSISGEYAKGVFSASAEYSGFVEISSSQTWSEEREETFEISVSAGQSVWVWQYVFGMSQYGDEIHFGSSITGDTDSQFKKPVKQ